MGSSSSSSSRSSSRLVVVVVVVVVVVLYSSLRIVRGILQKNCPGALFYYFPGDNFSASGQPGKADPLRFEKNGR